MTAELANVVTVLKVMNARLTMPVGSVRLEI
jgi:hypothetical protein